MIVRVSFATISDYFYLERYPHYRHITLSIYNNRKFTCRVDCLGLAKYNVRTSMHRN